MAQYIFKWLFTNLRGESVLEQGREPLDWAGLLRTPPAQLLIPCTPEGRGRASCELLSSRPLVRDMSRSEIFEKVKSGPITAPALPSLEWYHQINSVWSIPLFSKVLPQRDCFLGTEIFSFACMTGFYLVPLSNNGWPALVGFRERGWGVRQWSGECHGKMRRWKKYVWSEKWKTQIVE